MFSTISKETGLSIMKIYLIAVLIGGLITAIMFRVLFLSLIDSYELGYKFDLRDGRVTVLQDTVNVTDPLGSTYAEIRPRTGYIFKLPFVVKIHSVDLRPMQVCINANSRVLNCKLVRFNPNGIELFISWHGRANYSATKLNPILMSYAYDGSSRGYPFLTIQRELRGEEVTP